MIRRWHLSPGSPAAAALLSVALALAVASPARAETRSVFASWIIPMPYTPGQTTLQSGTDDIRAALEEGLDGFALDAFSGAQAQHMLGGFAKAADTIGAANFKEFLSADMTQSFTGPDIVAAMLAYGNNPHYFKLNGKPLLSTYGGEKFGDAWWQTNVLKPLADKRMPVTFVPYFDRDNPNGDTPDIATWTRTINEYPSADGLFNFLIAGSAPFYENDPLIGDHWWSTLTAEENLASALHQAGKVFIAPYSPYYWAVCHPVREYYEYQGGRGMDNAWRSIVTRQKPEMVEIVTWDDFSESTFIQPTPIPLTKTAGLPSEPHAGYYELLKYYIAWYRSGVQPKITGDGMFFFYRIEPKDAQIAGDSSACTLGPIAKNKLLGKIEDVIYVTTALTQPGKLVVDSGGTEKSYDVPAGLNTLDVPFAPGPQKFTLWRGTSKLAEAAGTDILAKPTTENFNVYGGYALADGTSSATWKPSDAWKSGPSASWFASP